MKDSLTLLSDDIDPFASEFLAVSPKKVKAMAGNRWLADLEKFILLESRVTDVQKKTKSLLAMHTRRLG